LVIISLRLVSLATQRFIFSIADDAQQISRLRHRTSNDRVNEDEPVSAASANTVLRLEDLSVAFANAGLDLYRPEYYS